MMVSRTTRRLAPTASGKEAEPKGKKSSNDEGNDDIGGESADGGASGPSDGASASATAEAMAMDLKPKAKNGKEEESGGDVDGRNEGASVLAGAAVADAAGEGGGNGNEGGGTAGENEAKVNIPSIRVPSVNDIDDDDGAGEASKEDGANNVDVPSVDGQGDVPSIGNEGDEEGPPIETAEDNNGAPPRFLFDDNDIDDDGRPPAAKRARTTVNADANAVPERDLRQAILKYKRRKGATYDLVLSAEQRRQQQQQRGGEAPLGIGLAAVALRNAHSYLSHRYETAFGEAYRGRPPTASHRALVVDSILASAPGAVASGVRRGDVLLFVNERLVNITDKKPLKYYRARINNHGDKPLKLTFFRSSEEGAEASEEEEEAELDRPWKNPPGPLTKLQKSALGVDAAEQARQARRAVLERRLEELEALQVEASAELAELRERDGIIDWKATEGDDEGAPAAAGNERRINALFTSAKGEEDYVVPPHILYFPPVRARRKELPALNDACNRVENLLRKRMRVDGEVARVRNVVAQARRQLDAREEELAALDESFAPALEALKHVEMEVQDGWKIMYLKLKEYYEVNGHSNCPEREDVKLSKWITRQRACYANAQLEKPNPSAGIIKPYQYDLLNRIEFCWNPREQQFVQNVAALKAFQREHGHANVPLKYENVHLANFVQKWRREYRLFQEGRPSNMTEDRLQVLSEAGFSWRDPSRTRRRSDTHHESWDGFISQLRGFKLKYGHFMVSAKF